MNKYRHIALSRCVLFRSLLYPVEVIFSSKSPKKGSKNMFSFNFQLSGSNDQNVVSCFVAMGDYRFPNLLEHLTLLDLIANEPAERRQRIVTESGRE